jgi:hypothetical protein
MASFQYMGQTTLFTRWGYLFPYACFILVLSKLFLLLAGKNGRSRRP